MTKIFWRCPNGDFEAKSEEEKIKHLRETKSDMKHKKAHKKQEKFLDSLGY